MPTSAISPKLHELLLKPEFRLVILRRFAFRGSVCAPALHRDLNGYLGKCGGKTAGFRMFPVVYRCLGENYLKSCGILCVAAEHRWFTPL